jgi:hypothetical protein
MAARLRNLPGPRLTIWGRRIHHGAFGGWLVVLGALLMVHDRHDYPWSFRDVT